MGKQKIRFLTITRSDYEQIVHQAREHLPIECCGILAGYSDGLKAQVIEVYPMRNVDQSPVHFSLDPEEQFKVYYDLKDKGLTLLGNYHSHPQTSARPSEEDIRLAYDPEAIYVIISLAEAEPVVKAFWIREGQYQEIVIQMID